MKILAFLEQLTVQQRNYFYLLELSHLINQTVRGGDARMTSAKMMHYPREYRKVICSL
ncbi:protein of unknown function [Xenorhabdus doucetiae]|uniref:Transposase n=1 Tax=Xenorhabdus doucetiae TaxID=351671 RepID=A0A068QPG7_9GAMM|nr:hypothetical protein LY16_00326 [Xenorhabdus doucetiae]CDG16873.1 protein of unknown function [Xenorhabdus doucetiae]